MAVGERVPVLVAAGGAPWEVEALRELTSAGSPLVLVKRCVDVPDLLASAGTGQGQVALVAAGLVGLDADAVGMLRRCGVGAVLVADADDLGRSQERASSWGVHAVLPADGLDGLVPVLRDAAAPTVPALPTGDDRAVAPASPSTERVADSPPAPEEEREPGRLVAVWGPVGAPGRTTLAVGLASELAHRGRETVLVDADPYGGAVAQHLGILDEVSGLLRAARLANAGHLEPVRLAQTLRQVSPRLAVLTGIPRADRWTEVREAAFDTVLEQARAACDHVVLDLGFSLEADPAAAFGGGGLQRNHMTLAGLEAADEVVVVGSADPVGLARLARGLVELLGVVPVATVRVVVNRTRPSLGWGEREVRSMIEGYVTPASVHFVPDDRAAADRALVAGRSLVEQGDSPLRRAVAAVADAAAGAVAGAPAGTREGATGRQRRQGRRTLRRRTAGRVR
ncbi:MAG TPA: hypothetical protein VLA97_03140 [Nocardioidaceae bacterium]|nr:hypothetical protein [Nocardioidaceae bacterium]